MLQHRKHARKTLPVNVDARTQFKNSFPQAASPQAVSRAVLRPFRCGFMGVSLVLCVLVNHGYGRISPNDEVINTIRGLSAIGDSDQRQIHSWVRDHVDAMASAVTQRPWNEVLVDYREMFREQYLHSNNSPAFKAEFAAQIAAVAREWFARSQGDAKVERSLARILADMPRVETLPGLLGGLKAHEQTVRYLCAKGLTNLRTQIAADKAALERVVKALLKTGLAEKNSVVLRHIYGALAYPAQQVGSVFDAYMALWNKKLDVRRGPAIIVDPAEIDAFEYFRDPAVLGVLSTDQKVRLVGALAVFVRMDAERYKTDPLSHKETVTIERRLDGAEAILKAIAGKDAGGSIVEQIAAGGHANRKAVLQQAYRWVGDPKSKTPGALNAAPWNVPLGAP